MKMVNKNISSTFRYFLDLVLEDISRCNIKEASAALAFHALLGLAPVMVLIIFVGSLLVDPGQIEIRIISYMDSQFGMDPVVIESILVGVFDLMTSILFSMIALVVIVLVVVGLVNHIREVFFRIFLVDIKEDGVLKMVKGQSLSIVYTGLLLLAVLALIGGNLIASFVFSFWLSQLLPIFLIEVVKFSLLTLVVGMIFFGVYRLTSVGRLPTLSNFIGTSVATFLLMLINIGLSIYLTFSVKLAVYEALGSVIVFLFWIYISAFVIFLGAVVAKAHARFIDSFSKKQLEI